MRAVIKEHWTPRIAGFPAGLATQDLEHATELGLTWSLRGDLGGRPLKVPVGSRN